MDKLFDLIEDNKEDMKDQLYKDLIEAFGEALKETSHAKIWRFQPIEDPITMTPSDNVMHFVDYESGIYVTAQYEDLMFKVSRVVVPKDSQWYKCAVLNTVKARKEMDKDDIEERRARYEKLTVKQLRKAFEEANVQIPTQIQGKRVNKALMIELALDCPVHLNI